MANTLTAAGLKFCMALLGLEAPTYDQCQSAMWATGAQTDSYWRSPTVNGVMPNPFKKPEGFKECIEVGDL